MEKSEVKKYLERLNLIFYGIIALPLCGFAYLYLENHAGRISPFLTDESVRTLQYIFPTLIIIISGLGILIPGAQIKKMDHSRALVDRLMEFQQILIMRYALFEAACVTSVVAFYLTAEEYYSVFFVGTIVLFSLNRPTPYRIISNLRIKGKEKELF